jgi:hypothetical protein
MGKGSYITQVPLIVPGCVGWLDASDTSASNITASAGAVSSVRNKANSQIPFIQGTGANQPISGTRTINGLNALDFDGANYWLTANGLISSFTGSDKPFTILSVCLCDAPTAAPQSSIWAIGSSASPNQFQSQVYQNSQNIANRRDDGGTIVTSGASYISGVNLNCLVFTGTTVSSYTNATANYSGSSQDVGVLTLDRFAIGATIRNTNSHFFDGTIGEVIIYNTALSDANRISIQQYLGNKWGIAAP